jgi:hypothetical protein
MGPPATAAPGAGQVARACAHASARRARARSSPLARALTASCAATCRMWQVRMHTSDVNAYFTRGYLRTDAAPVSKHVPKQHPVGKMPGMDGLRAPAADTKAVLGELRDAMGQMALSRVIDVFRGSQRPTHPHPLSNSPSRTHPLYPTLSHSSSPIHPLSHPVVACARWLWQRGTRTTTAPSRAASLARRWPLSD